ncbi:MAG: HAMP domain-containing sensor histidine kinase [Bacteroidota bacterium]|nr:HAMP domain-containing sensor histidine kinase [Bacteroidota bacterium]
MNKHKHKILSVSFALVLIGILIIQAYWVRFVIEVRNNQFDNAVFNSLQSTVGALEQKENITFITKLDQDTIVKHVTKKPRKKRRVQVFSEAKVTKNETSASSYSYEYSVTDDSANVKIVSKSGPKASAGTFVFSSDSLTEAHVEEFMDTLNLENKLSRIGVLIHKIAAGKEDSVLSLPKGEEVEKLLRSSLAQNNIDIPFYLGMKVNDADAYKTTNADTGALFSSDYHSELFPNDVLNRKGLLYVSFPNKNSFIFSEMIWLLIALSVFTLLIVLMFYTTLSNFKKQKRLNELKSDFINNMTHELKTPLATIQLASEVIMKQSGDPQSPVHQMANTIKSQSKRMDDDVKNILQAALLDNSTAVALNYSKFDLKKTIEEMIFSFDLIAKEKNVSIKLRYDATENISADKDLLEKALNNLVDNAIKYSDLEKEVRIEVKSLDKALQISVTDKGSGISKEDIPHVFDKFYRAGKGNIHYNKGYGLGLSFVKKVAELHNGKVELVSERNKGTIITLTIPQTI